jgi:N utilization substance protein B
MINRDLIRSKVLQTLYAFFQTQNTSLPNAEKELMRNLEKTYDLYLHLLLLVGVLTDMEQKRVESLKYKFLFTEEDRNPNLRFAHNRLAEQLFANETLCRFAEKNGSIWDDTDRMFLKKLRSDIIDSDFHQEYLRTPDTYEADRDFWRKIYKWIIAENEQLPEILEDKQIFWSSDVEIILSFVQKTINRFEETGDNNQAILPMFDNEADREYALLLLRKTILEYDAHLELINRYIANWDIERIAAMDLYVMQLALTEIKHCQSIPISVSLNEYIELAKLYSTPQSSGFINGILDRIIADLRAEGKLFKG